MKKDSNPGNDDARIAARRRQVLEAAAHCFREEGFHGASMAKISRAAGMSVGHIYHYFENKEAIIGAIVHEHLESMLAVMDGIEAAGPEASILERLVAGVEVGVSQCSQPDTAALMLEVTSEGARNPKVAQMLREADAVGRARFRALLRAGSCRGAGLSDADLERIVVACKCLFEGLWVRVVRQPDMDPAELRLAISQALRGILPPF